jgi:hypothetical protein
MVPRFDLFTPPPLSFIITKLKETAPVRDTGPPSPYAFWIEHPAVFERGRLRAVVRMYETPRADFVVDLSPYLFDLPPGEYTLRTGYYPSDDFKKPRWLSKTTTFRLKQLTEADKRLLRKAIPSLDPDRRKVERHDWVAKDINIALLKSELPREKFGALALHCFLSSALQQGSAAKAPLDLLDKVPASLKPLADCLRYEVLLAKKEQKAAKQLRERLLREHPGFKWQLDMIDEDGGILAALFRRPPR